MKNKIVFLIVFILLIILVLFEGYNYYTNHQRMEEIVSDNSVCGKNQGCELENKRYKGFEVGDQIPNIELIDFKGNKTNLYDLLKGKDKFILSLAVDWCSDCKRQDEKLNKYYDNLGDDKGAAVLFVNYTSKDGSKKTNKDQAKKFVEDQNYNFPTFWDEEDIISKKFGSVKATPTNIVLDGNGIIKAKTEEIDMDILFLDNKESIYK